MNKYSPQQLQEMAKILLASKEAGDEKYLEFVIMMNMFTGMSTEAIEQKIIEFAKGGGHD